MTCERVRWLLSLDPTGSEVAHDPALCAHLDACDRCRAFARALATIDGALADRPLAQLRPELAADILAATQRHPRAELEQPFPRPFLALAAVVTLFALVGGALLLHISTSSWPPAPGPAQLWLNPSWPSDASLWLSLQAEHAAEVVLPMIAGTLITVAAAAAGFRASGRRDPGQQPAKPRR